MPAAGVLLMDIEALVPSRAPAREVARALLPLPRCALAPPRTQRTCIVHAPFGRAEHIAQLSNLLGADGKKDRQGPGQ